MKKGNTLLIAVLLQSIWACPNLSLAQTCGEATGRFFSLFKEPGLHTCDALTYPGHAEECIAYHRKWLPILRTLEHMNCQVPSRLSYTWKEQADLTESLLELMTKYPNGPMGLFDEMERARRGEAERLDAERRKR